MDKIQSGIKPGEMVVAVASESSGKSIVNSWFLAYSKYLQLNEPDITEEDICFRFAETSNAFIKMYNENPEQWSGNIAVMLTHYADMYERLSENLIYRGATTSSEKTRWSL